MSEKYNLSSKTINNIWDTYIEEIQEVNQDMDSPDLEEEFGK